MKIQLKLITFAIATFILVQASEASVSGEITDSGSSLRKSHAPKVLLDESQADALKSNDVMGQLKKEEAIPARDSRCSYIMSYLNNIPSNIYSGLYSGVSGLGKIIFAGYIKGVTSIYECIWRGGKSAPAVEENTEES